MLWLWLSSHALGADLLVDVGDDWCATLASAAAGDRVLLAPGPHEGTCSVTPQGTEGSPVTLTVQDSERRATLTASTATGNLLDLYSGHLHIESVDFGPTPINVEAVRLHTGDGLEVRDCTFAVIDSQAIVANSAGNIYSAIVIENNTFEDVTGTAVSIGCQAGAGDCAATDVVVQGNRILGVTDGEGIALELDATGHVRHNTVSGTTGAAIRVAGDAATAGGVEIPATGTLPSTIVEGNHLSGGSTGVALAVDGGPVLVRNNVVRSGSLGALRVENAGAPDRMDHIHVVGNALAGGDGPAVTLVDWLDTATVSFEVNGVWDPNAPGAGVPANPGTRPWAGNVDCSSETACFEDIAGGDPSPRAGGELVGAGIDVADGRLPTDFCGSARTTGDPAGPLITSLDSPLSLTDDTDPTTRCSPTDTGIDTGIDTGEDSSEPTYNPGGGNGLPVPAPDTATEPALPSWSAAWKAGETGGIGCSSTGLAATWTAVWLGILALARRRTDD